MNNVLKFFWSLTRGDSGRNQAARKTTPGNIAWSQMGTIQDALPDRERQPRQALEATRAPTGL